MEERTKIHVGLDVHKDSIREQADNDNARTPTESARRGGLAERLMSR